MNLDGKELEQVLRDSKPIQIKRLEIYLPDSYGDAEYASDDYISNEPIHHQDYFQEVNSRETTNFLLKGLSSEEKLIVILYYYESMTMKEIGHTLDLSESRVSQIHSGIMKRLKTKFTGRPLLNELTEAV